MPKPFSLSTFFRMTPDDMLAEFFRRFDTDIPLRDKGGVKEHHVLLMSLMDDIDESVKNHVEKTMHDIAALASKDGMAAFHEAALTCHQPHWLDDLPNKGRYPTSMHAWLRYPKLFESALANFRFSGLTYWRRRAHLPIFAPEFTGEKLHQLKEALENFFEERQGRGRVCTVDLYDRGNGMYYITAHPDDYAEDMLVHDDLESLNSQTLCKTFEVTLAYDSRRGCCDLYAKVPLAIKRDLEQLFLETIFEEELPPYEQAPFDLLPLLKTDFTLTTASEFRITAFIHVLSLKWPHGAMAHQTKITESPYRDVRDAFNQAKYPVEGASAEHVKFQFLFHGVDGGRDKSITFEIRQPFTCTLRNQPQEYLELAHKLLQKWGIEHENQTTDHEGAVHDICLPLGTPTSLHDQPESQR